jgi:cell division protein FtsW (lipid II flippase)
MSTLLLIPLIILGMCVWAAILFRWRLGLIALIVYTPFTGLVVSAFSPSPVGNLIRDFLIILPLYLAFFLTRRQVDRFVAPVGFLAIIGILTVLVAINSTFGASSGSMVAVVGAKIWLFYIPLVFVVSAAIRDKAELLSLMRLFVAMGWIPCAVGILMWLGAINYDYKESIELVYGDFARNATQGFVAFKVGESTIYRIPGTFQFAAQYSMFCIFMIFPVLIQVRLESARNWRAFGYVSLALFIFAALTSGSRGAFLHVPFLFALVGMLRFGFGRGGNALIVFAFIVFATIVMAQFDQSAIFDHVAELAAANGQFIVLGGLEFAIEQGGLWGQGVGTGTIAARHVIGPTDIAIAAIENYYAKAWLELGALGFITVVALFVYLTLAGIRMASASRDSALRDVGLVVVAMVVFIAYLSTRGWVLDQDPMAYYYWLMVGILFKVPYLEVSRQPQNVQAQKAWRGRVGGPIGSLPRTSGFK